MQNGSEAKRISEARISVTSDRIVHLYLCVLFFVGVYFFTAHPIHARVFVYLRNVVEIVRGVTDSLDR